MTMLRAPGEAGVRERLAQEVAVDRRFGGWLKDDCAAGQERRKKLQQCQGERTVPWNDRGDDADRLGNDPPGRAVNALTLEGLARIEHADRVEEAPRAAPAVPAEQPVLVRDQIVQLFGLHVEQLAGLP